MLFALTLPGLASLLRRELESVDGIRVRECGFDGRSDVVIFTADDQAIGRLSRLRMAEDIFIGIGRTTRSDGDRASWIAARLLTSGRVQRALTTRTQMLRPVRARPSCHVIVRVLQERSFLRTDLRRNLASALEKQQPQWHFADPSDLELWVVEYQPGRIVAGLRASDARMRQHGGRATERPGALRPTVAAAMVTLAGLPGGTLLDPCCGSGTILAEALHAGWTDVRGADIDPAAVDTARHNLPAANVVVGDAERIDVESGSIDACVSNLPFGRQYHVDGNMHAWLRVVLAETARVTRPGGRVVLLSPADTRALAPPILRPVDRIPVRLLGTRTILRSYDR